MPASCACAPGRSCQAGAASYAGVPACAPHSLPGCLYHLSLLCMSATALAQALHITSASACNPCWQTCLCMRLFNSCSSTLASEVHAAMAACAHCLGKMGQVMALASRKAAPMPGKAQARQGLHQQRLLDGGKLASCQGLVCGWRLLQAAEGEHC